MSTPSITPNQPPDAPDVQSLPPSSTLGSLVSQTPLPEGGAPNGSTPSQTMSTQVPAAPQPGRLQTIIKAVAQAIPAGLAGIPDKGRPTFITGLGEGARGFQAAQAQQQAIKFKTFDDQIRMGTDFVPPRLMNIFTNKVNGFALDGKPINHDELPGVLGAAQAQRDNLAKNGGTPNQLKALDNMIGIYQANLKALDEHKASVTQQDEQAKLNAANSPESIAGASKKAAAVSDAELPNKLKVAQATSDIKANAAAAQATTSGWLPKVGADEKKKAELAENIAFNANEVAKIVMRRPDILGAIAGRYTNAEQMIGNNDPDISALGVHVHNMAMANSGVHGFRSQEGVESYERQLLNNFKNGPAAMAGALRASTGSVQTFIDNARPETYKTHSKQGGAVRGMMETQ